MTGMQMLLAAGGQFIEPQPLGLSASLLTVTGPTGAWTEQTVDLSAYAGHQIKLVWRATMGTGTTWYNDVQIDTITLDGNTFDFEAGSQGFEMTWVHEPDYALASFAGVATDTSSTRWNRHTGDTPSSGVGMLGAQGGSYFLYTEASSPTGAGDMIWLRSPTLTLSNNPGLLSFYEGRDGINADTTLDVFVDVIAQP